TVRCLQILLPTDVRTPAERARGAPVRYEPREPLVVTGSRDATLRVWRLPSPTRDAPHHPQASDAASSSNNNSSAAAAAAAAAANPYFARTLEGHSDSVRAVAAFGSLVVSGSYDCSVRVWDASTGVCLHRLEGHTAKVYTIVLDPDMHLIMSGSMDGTIRVWDWDTGL
ncbi:SCF ubiquitin ligase complex subunit cdc4, partial [Coemansia sp. RSA 1804]